VRPNFKLLAGNKDITAAFKKRFISLTLSDNNGFENDTLSIVIDDRNNELELPKAGIEIECWLGYDDDLYNKGSFEVDEIIESGAPETIMIIAKGSNINKSLKQSQTHTFENINLGTLVNTIAKRNGMSAKVSEFLTSIEIVQLNQSNETDLNFLTKLANYYDAKFKAISSVLLFYLKDDFKKTSGEALTPIVINKHDCSSWHFSETDRSKYDSVIAKWRDNDAGKIRSVKIGTGDIIYSLKSVSASAGEAENKATSKYNDLLRGTIKGSLSVIGNPKIASEFEIELKGFRRKLKLKCESCTHTLNDSGYKTSLEMINKK
jgi:phage protein D